MTDAKTYPTIPAHKPTAKAVIMQIVKIIHTPNQSGACLYFGWVYIGEHFTYNGNEYKKVSALRAVNVVTNEKAAFCKSDKIVVV